MIIIPNFRIVGRVGVVLLQPQFTVTLFLLQKKSFNVIQKRGSRNLSVCASGGSAGPEESGGHEPENRD